MRDGLVALGLVLAAGSSGGCDRNEPRPTSLPHETSAAPAVSLHVTSPPPAPAPANKVPIGSRAPDFTLTDLDGKQVHLADFKGKTVVLEWFNPGCPFVRASHTKGSLVDAAKRHTAAGVVWLAINSGAAGKQGAGVEANQAGKKQFQLAHPILLDENGQVGRAYGATNTPHMFVIDSAGVLVYKGAVDNSPDGEAQSPAGGKLIRYVDVALESLAAGKRVEVSETPAYGCSVKYGS